MKKPNRHFTHTRGNTAAYQWHSTSDRIVRVVVAEEPCGMTLFVGLFRVTNEVLMPLSGYPTGEEYKRIMHNFFEVDEYNRVVRDYYEGHLALHFYFQEKHLKRHQKSRKIDKLTSFRLWRGQQKK